MYARRLANQSPGWQYNESLTKGSDKMLVVSRRAVSPGNQRSTESLQPLFENQVRVEKNKGLNVNASSDLANILHALTS
jgi:hypothetical protein